MTRKRFKTVQLTEKSFNQLQVIARALKMPKSHFLSDLIDHIFDIASQFDSLNIEYSGLFTQAWLKLNFSGRSNIIYGSGSEEQIKEAMKTLKREKVWET